jgi:hypothetical protein
VPQARLRGAPPLQGQGQTSQTSSGLAKVRPSASKPFSTQTLQSVNNSPKARQFIHPQELALRIIRREHLTSVITSKPAIHGHFKTGHMGARNVFFG